VDLIPPAYIAQPFLQRYIKLFIEILHFRKMWKAISTSAKHAAARVLPASTADYLGVEENDGPRPGLLGSTHRLASPAVHTILVGLYPIVTFQYSSTTLYQFSYQVQ
jgi:hypothetical protein